MGVLLFPALIASVLFIISHLGEISRGFLNIFFPARLYMERRKRVPAAGPGRKGMEAP